MERLENLLLKQIHYMSRFLRNLTGVSNEIQRKPDCSATKDNLGFSDFGSKGMFYVAEKTKVLLAARSRASGRAYAKRS